MKKKMITLIIVLTVIIGGIYFFSANQSVQENVNQNLSDPESQNLPIKETFSCQVDADCEDLLQYWDPPAGCTSFSPTCQAGTCRVQCDEFEPKSESGDDTTPTEMLNEASSFIEITEDQGENLISPEPGEVFDPEGESSGLHFSGNVLAGSQSPLIEFNQSDYQVALASNKLVVLYFYASWCPICKNEASNNLYPAFNELNTDSVVGFRVNYNDSDTDNNEKDLAKQFNVTYQHTKVFVQNGQRTLKAMDTWNKQKYLDEIDGAI